MGATSTMTPTSTATPTPTLAPMTSFYTVALCRVADTRDPAGPYGAPALAAGSTRIFSLAGRCNIPAGAKAVSFNLTVTGPTTSGSLTLYAAGATAPNTSAINYNANQTRANNAIIGVSAGTELAVKSNQGSGTTHLILDVNGYFL
jgi:hypothetical protein